MIYEYPDFEKKSESIFTSDFKLKIIFTSISTKKYSNLYLYSYPPTI